LLQENLNLLTKWCIDCQLSLAPHKCQHLAITQKIKTGPVNEYCINSECIAKCSIVKDLGVFLYSDLKWAPHISHKTKMASMCSYQILRSFSTSNILILLKAFTTYVHPKLEYNTSVWSPHLHEDINTVESVQRRFTKLICRRCNVPYSSYSDRRIEFDLILTFKICYQLCDIPFDHFFLFF